MGSTPSRVIFFVGFSCFLTKDKNVISHSSSSIYCNPKSAVHIFSAYFFNFLDDFESFNHVSLLRITKYDRFMINLLILNLKNPDFFLWFDFTRWILWRRSHIASDLLNIIGICGPDTPFRFLCHVSVWCQTFGQEGRVFLSSPVPNGMRKLVYVPSCANL